MIFPLQEVSVTVLLKTFFPGRFFISPVKWQSVVFFFKFKIHQNKLSCMESHNFFMRLFWLYHYFVWILHCVVVSTLCCDGCFFIMCCGHFIGFCSFFIMSCYCNEVLKWCVFIMTCCGFIMRLLRRGYTWKGVKFAVILKGNCQD